ncbi:hypothetical protein DCG74_23540 [Bradyrhizobium sp. WBAH42]|nr:hypothetical protein [Bradyrhizobium sp. WBAH30]MDD1546604.1 hypothetical protein [Bradyrhizobium sp. WBAH41]MDD1560379.1 hypothetical protein [Bradyrhizobium sp. WBAH23]MDD1567812.1 hypothetical protein [Bradyrhizobium sp. WBAH33]MDD1594016.1 hypothetical protein [Bradyrhizobium sp. WBAH42]NRB91711.1 hypothetical protein [Bradyrhizobium sp. WBAH10]QCJ91234.1 hypothetical protein DAA57_23980 [Bradyrhizobium yuanmingense]
MYHGDDKATPMPGVPATVRAFSSSVRGDRRRRVGCDVEGAEMEFLAGGVGRFGTLRQQRERGLRVSLPDLEIAGGDGEPAERVHVASGLGDPADPVPGDLTNLDLFSRDLVDCHSVPRSQVCKMTSGPRHRPAKADPALGPL